MFAFKQISLEMLSQKNNVVYIYQYIIKQPIIYLKPSAYAALIKYSSDFCLKQGFPNF